ncbi:olfactory receptor 5P6-like [Petaurus breviceps papuanus]|uniref:olfactory receptor 5P6-like n=1 Tax=Petaurus breviceps papuanus TaxID=3040969 RepID=UPI0036DC69E1
MGGNHTTVTWFLLVRLTERKELKGVLFVIFLLVYSVTVLGNLGMPILVGTNPQLHTPTHFFLTIPSFLDFSSKHQQVNLLTSDRSISFAACVVQMATMALHGRAECLVLTITAYDTALFHPLLHHAASVPTPVCGAGCRALCCRSLQCPILPVVTRLLQRLSPSAAITPITISIILVSYTYILAAICRVHSLKAQQKAFSSCASHLTAISLFYGTIIFIYTQPSSSKSSDEITPL